MKNIKLMALIGLVAFIPMLIGCASVYPVHNMLYVEAKLPVAVGYDAKALKSGTSECTSILGLVTTGDASLNTAMRNGNITKISHVDWEVKNILGIVGNYKVTVYGE